MREHYALRYLQKLVDWDETRLANEVGWLRRLSLYKYDSYQDFVAGERFISALLRWLKQFNPEDRDFAYAILKEHLIYLSNSEILHLVRRTVPAHFHPAWLHRAAQNLSLRPYEVMLYGPGKIEYERLVKRSLFVGLSDGARIDAFRRANVGQIGNEQVTVTYELSSQKLESLLEDLRKSEKDEKALFEMVFLIDDFLGSGTTLCRASDGKWKGKLPKFGKAIESTNTFSEHLTINVHHYIATDFGIEKAVSNLQQFSKETTLRHLKDRPVLITADLILQGAAGFRRDMNASMDTFLDKYYDPGIMTPSLWEGKCQVQNGFADCGLSLVLEHNTPNNSLGLLWADSGKIVQGHRMISLFRRRQRHG